MLRGHAVLVLFLLSATAPAGAQMAGPLAGPGVPSYNPGVPSYNPGVPRQAPAPFTGSIPAPRSAPGIPPMHRQTYFAPRRAFPPQVLVPYGYGTGYGYSYGGQTIVVVPQTVIIPAPRRRTTMDNPFFGDLGDPFF